MSRTTTRMTADTAQPAEPVRDSANKATRYVMPGLCPKLVSAFRRKKGVIPTSRTIAQNEKVEPSVVTAALIYELYEQIDELRAIVSRRPDARELSVRNFTLIRRSA